MNIQAINEAATALIEGGEYEAALPLVEKLWNKALETSEEHPSLTVRLAALFAAEQFEILYHRTKRLAFVK